MVCVKVWILINCILIVKKNVLIISYKIIKGKLLILKKRMLNIIFIKFEKVWLMMFMRLFFCFGCVVKIIVGVNINRSIYS